MHRLMITGTALTFILPLLAACPQDDVPLTLNLITVPAGAASCQPDIPKGILGNDQRLKSKGTLKKGLGLSHYTLRLTFIGRAKGPVGPVTLRRHEMYCSRLIRSGEDLQLVIPMGEESPGVGPNRRLSLRIDAFDPVNNTLAFSGMVNDVNLASAAEITVYMQPPHSKTCSYIAHKARAFHTATLLPNGDLLVLGGITTPGNDTSSGDSYGVAAAETSVEVFHTNTLNWELLSAPTPAPRGLARAFHKALLLPTPAEGPYRILLLGGTMASDATGKVLLRVAHNGTFRCKDGTSCDFFFNYLPHESAAPGETGIVTYFPEQQDKPPRITYHALDNTEIAGGYFPQLTLLNDTQALLVPGGRSYNANTQATQGFSDAQKHAYWIDLSGGETPTATTGTFLGIHAGHAAAPTAAGAFVVGGVLDGSTADQVAHNMLLAPQKASFQTAAMRPSNPSKITEAGFGSLTALGQSDIALAEGHRVNDLLLVPGFPGPPSDLAKIGKRPHTPQKKVSQCGSGTCRPNEFCVDGTCDALSPQRVAITPSGLAVQPTSPTTPYPTVGYGGSTRLADGRVMLSGGNLAVCRLPCTAAANYCPKDTKCGADHYCEASTPTNFCTTDAVVIIPKQAGDAIAHPAPKLSVGRYGHTAVRLLDNSVFIVGGLRVDKKGDPVAIASAEMYLVQDVDLATMPLWIEHKGKILHSYQDAPECQTIGEFGHDARSTNETGSAHEAGTPDAGTPDAGTPDAGTPDAGTPEAGTPDAGTPDL